MDYYPVNLPLNPCVSPGLQICHGLAMQGFYRQGLWMKLYGHLCLKRTLLWSTSRAVGLMDLGPINKKDHKSLVKTAEKYTDSEGKSRYKGTGSTLRKTQFPSRMKHYLYFLLF